MSPIRALHDLRLRARVVSRRPLRYDRGADPDTDRPAHVRAASSLAWYAGRIAIVQDDANFVGLLDPLSGEVAAAELPAGPENRRRFEELLGNKKQKLDLEACFTVPRPGRPLFVALGSGSAAARETLVTLEPDGQGGRHAHVVPAAPLYAALRDHPDFATSELNLEGAVWLDSHVRLFQRSNGRPLPGRRPLDATGDLDWAALSAWLEAPETAPVPALDRVLQYDLGTVGATRLTFTDACAADGGRVWFVAGAEASPDALRDGEVAGAALGVLEPDGAARLCLLTDAHGTPVREKAEGILHLPESPRTVLVVFDPDDPSRPAELAAVELEGSW